MSGADAVLLYVAFLFNAIIFWMQSFYCICVSWILTKCGAKSKFDISDYLSALDPPFPVLPRKVHRNYTGYGNHVKAKYMFYLNATCINEAKMRFYDRS